MNSPVRLSEGLRRRCHVAQAHRPRGLRSRIRTPAEDAAAVPPVRKVRKAIEGEKRVDRFVYLVHAVVIAKKLVPVETLRVGHTDDLLIVKHEAHLDRDSDRPRLQPEILHRALRGHLPLDLIGKDRELAGTIAPEFFTSSGERREIPSKFLLVVKAITRAVNCVDCTHPHFVVAQGRRDEAADGVLPGK